MLNENDGDTRERIKNAARLLFSERGIDEVSVRDILTAAGQKNIGAIGYYFQSKDALAREILVEGAKVIDDRRNAMLDDLERQQKPISLHDIMSIIVKSSLHLKADPEAETYLRLVGMFQRRDAALFAEVVSSHLDLGFRRCIVHVRRLLPDKPRNVVNERIIFMMLMISASLSMHEAALEQHKSKDLSAIYGGRIWQSPTLIENLIDACEGIFRQPISALTTTSIA